MNALRLTPYALLLGLAVSGSAYALSLDSLLAGGSITEGTLTFGNFQLLGVGNTSSGVPTADLTQIDVVGASDANGNGLNFTATPSLSVTGSAGAPDWIDLTFGFTVTSSGAGINSGWLGLLASSFTDAAADYAHMDEYISSTAFIDPAAPVVAPAMSVGAGNDPGFSSPDSAGFGAVSTIYVTKNLLLWADATGNVATLDGFAQRFDTITTVPEPSTLALLGLGALGFLIRRKGTC